MIWGKKRMDKIEELLKNPQTVLQKQALTDTSYKNIDHSFSDDDTNFELATYGDAVLKLALCKIYREYKENGLRFSENLSDWKKKYESDKVLVQVIAQHYKLLNFLEFDRNDKKKTNDYKYVDENKESGEEKAKDEEHPSEGTKRRYKYIATAMEACIAAVYIENGENEVIEIVKKWIQWIDKETNSSDT